MTPHPELPDVAPTQSLRSAHNASAQDPTGQGLGGRLEWVKSSGYRGCRSTSALTRRRSRRRGRGRTARRRPRRRRCRRIPHRPLGRRHRRGSTLEAPGPTTGSGQVSNQGRVPNRGQAAPGQSCQRPAGEAQDERVKSAPVRTAVRTIRPRKLGTAGLQRSRAVKLEAAKALVRGHIGYCRAPAVNCGKPREEHYGSEGWGFESLPAHQIRAGQQPRAWSPTAPGCGRPPAISPSPTAPERGGGAGG